MQYNVFHCRIITMFMNVCNRSTVIVSNHSEGEKVALKLEGQTALGYTNEIVEYVCYINSFHYHNKPFRFYHLCLIFY